MIKITKMIGKHIIVDIDNMTNNQLIEQDWEREAQKDFIYLCEREKEIEQEYYEYINRLPGEIIIIDKRKKKHEHKFSSI